MDTKDNDLVVDGQLVMYHYTFARNLPSIIANGLRASIQIPGNRNSDAQWGDGQYFTDLTPAESSLLTRYQQSYALFNIPWKWGGGGALLDVGWIALTFGESEILFVAPLFGGRVQHRSICLHSGKLPLQVSSRLVGTGVVSFSKES